MCKRLSFTGPHILFLSRGRGALPTSTTNTALTHQTFLPACLCPLCSSWNKTYWLEALKWSVLRCSEMSIPFSKPFDSWRTESKGIMSDAECKAILILTQGTSVLSTMATSLHITLFILTTGRYYHYTHCTVQELRGWEVPDPQPESKVLIHPPLLLVLMIQGQQRVRGGVGTHSLPGQMQEQPWDLCCLVLYRKWSLDYWFPSSCPFYLKLHLVRLSS